MQVFAGHEGPVQCGQFTPDGKSHRRPLFVTSSYTQLGKRIVTGDGVGTLILWEPRSPAPVFKLSAADGRFGLNDGITSLAVNPLSTVAVVGGATGGVRVVNLAKGDIIGALDGHGAEESVEAIAFVEFGTAGGAGIVVTGATDGKICVWDLGTMSLRTTLAHTVGTIRSLTLSVLICSLNRTQSPRFTPTPPPRPTL